MPHRAVVEYARAELVGLLEPGHLERIDRIRKRRHDVEYRAIVVGSADVEADLAVALSVHEAVMTSLS